MSEAIIHRREPNGAFKSERATRAERPRPLDLDAIERQIKMEKDIGNAKTRIHLCHLQELVNIARVVRGR